ncbi:uncharacterized protein LOC129595850 [Paramacrobiotus metropolitanus]|uniref:uncharacterized protein LOC129595850 n=1 Tax=Paramacrobiotus metropolitanus TaxID=2943436 RepID=UPI00244656D1|nr:uncharacterized protein LOC129595850 [Paramacrobiotus metropolitanus]
MMPKNMAQLFFLSVIAASLVFYPFAHSYKEGCENRFFHCTGHDYFGNTSLAEVLAAPWPMTDEYINTHRPLAETFCRGINESAHCFRGLNQDCPGIFEHLQLNKVGKGWFHAEFLSAAAKLCQLPRGSLPFTRAMVDCSKKSSGFGQRVLNFDWNHYEDISPNATAAQHNLCEVSQLFMERLNGTAARTALVEKCGETSVDVLVDAMKDMRTLHCFS